MSSFPSEGAGNCGMVDISGKSPTHREAIAVGQVELSQDVMLLIHERKIPKGDVFTVAKMAGIQAAKETFRWVPLCHPTAIAGVSVDIEFQPHGVRVTSAVKAFDKTGVEMEALCAVSAACLTIYDMCKAVDKAMSIGPIRLLKKSGGRSGLWTNPK